VGVLHELRDLRDHETKTRSKKSSMEETVEGDSCAEAVMIE